MSSAVRSAAPTMTTHSTAVRRLLRGLSSWGLSAGRTSVGVAVVGGRSTGGPTLPPKGPSAIGTCVRPPIALQDAGGGPAPGPGQVSRCVDDAPVGPEAQQQALEPCPLADGQADT